MKPIAARMANLGTENAFSIGRDIAKCEAKGMRVIRFNLGAPDFRSAPFLNRIAADALAAGRSGYCDPQGIPAFRQAVSDHLLASRKVEVSPDRIVIFPGAKPPIGFTFLSCVNPGDEVLYPSPGFPIYESWVRFVGATPIPYPVTQARDFALGADDIAPFLSPKVSLIILCSPSNPTGGVLSREELAGIAALIREKAPARARVYSDEIYEQILFDGRSHESILSHPGMAERTILASGLSKGFAMTGWRLGWAALPTPKEAELYTRLNINTVSCVPPFLQEAGAAAYADPRSAPIVSKMVQAFERRRDWIVPALNRIPGFSCRLPQGAFYVFPDVSGACLRLGAMEAFERLSPEARARTSPAGMLQLFLLYRHGVAAMDRASFGRIGAGEEHHLRLSIANSMEDIREGASRLARAARDAEGFRSFAEGWSW